MFKTFLSYYKPYKGILLFLVIGSLLRALLELFFPYVVKLMLEQHCRLRICRCSLNGRQHCLPCIW